MVRDATAGTGSFSVLLLPEKLKRDWTAEEVTRWLRQVLATAGADDRMTG